MRGARVLDTTPLSPDWWLLRLGRKLRDRQMQLNCWWDYYSGNPPLPQGPKGPASVYLDFQRKARTNFLQMVVDASVHRLLAIGVTDAAGKSDDQAWLWWQQNRMDSRQKKIFRTALSQSESYVMVGPHPKDPRRPLITPEHPREVIVEYDPVTGERIAALKAFYDDIEGVGKAEVLLPEVIVKYQTSRRSGGRALPWGPESWDLRRDPEDNPLHEVPVVAFTCAPELGELPVPDFAQGIDIQDRINLSMLNRMTAERYSAFRQKYVTGHKFQTITDPETGLPILDPITGQPQIEQPFRPDPGTLWASTGEKVQFGEFSQTDLIGYLKTHQADILDLLILTHTPAYYYAGDLINVSADTVIALDTNHVAKIGEYQTGFGESLEDMFGLAAKIAGSERDFVSSEIRWKDPRQLNPSVVADMATKIKSIGYPLGVVAERMGESPQQVKRITTGQAQDAFLAASLAAPQPQEPTPSTRPAPDNLD